MGLNIVSGLWAALVLGPMLALAGDAGRPAWNEMFRQLSPEHVPVAQAMAQLLEKSDLKASETPTLVLASYRTTDGAIRDLVVQIYRGDPQALLPLASLPDPKDTIAEGDRSSWLEGLASFTASAGVNLGDPTVWRLRQRAWQMALAGDPTFLLEQTFEPLQVVVILPEGGKVLPRSLRTRVRAVVLTAEMTYDEWRIIWRFTTDNTEDTARVADVLAVWRDMAITLLNRYGSGQSAQRIREAARASTVQTSERQSAIAIRLPVAAVRHALRQAPMSNNGCNPGPPCGPHEIPVCHRDAGTTNATLCLPVTDVSAHLAHGDTCGVCPQEGGKP